MQKIVFLTTSKKHRASSLFLRTLVFKGLLTYFLKDYLCQLQVILFCPHFPNKLASSVFNFCIVHTHTWIQADKLCFSSKATKFMAGIRDKAHNLVWLLNCVECRRMGRKSRKQFFFVFFKLKRKKSTFVAFWSVCQVNPEWVSFRLPALPFLFWDPRHDYGSSLLSNDPLPTHPSVLVHGKGPAIFCAKFKMHAIQEFTSQIIGNISHINISINSHS